MKRILWFAGLLAMLAVVAAIVVANTWRRGDAAPHDEAPPLAEHVEPVQPSQSVVATPTRTYTAMTVAGRPGGWRGHPPETTLVGGEEMATPTRQAANRPPSADPFRLVSSAGNIAQAVTVAMGSAAAQDDMAERRTSRPASYDATAGDLAPTKSVGQAAAESGGADGDEQSAAPPALLEAQPSAGNYPSTAEPSAGTTTQSGGPAMWAIGDVGRSTGASGPQQAPGPLPRASAVGSREHPQSGSPAAPAASDAANRGGRSAGQLAEVFDDDEPRLLRADQSATPAVAPIGGGGVAWPPQQPPVVGGLPNELSAAEELPGGGIFGEGNGRPGAKQLEGPQTAQLTIHKIGPPEVQVGKSATFRIAVRNIGNVSASGVEIHDPVPKGTRVVGTRPPAQRGVHGELVFSVGTLKPGEEVTVEVELMPLVEGEIGSVATVTFNADASARTMATKPQLVLETVAPQSVLIGEEVVIGIVLSNPGTGVATNVVLYEQVPEGMYHPAGAELEYAIGQLRPGDQRKLELRLVAKQPGEVTNLLTAKGDGNIQAEDRRTIHITAPKLELAVDGPRKRYLEREGTYQIAIANPGTAPAEQVELVAVLPSGLRFVSANNNGYYDEANRAVHWRLEQLPTGERGTVEMVTMPVEAGQQSLRLVASAQRGVRVEREHPVIIEGIAAVMFQVADTVDPIEVGTQTTYEIRVVNQGSKAATNLRLAVLLPPELKPVAADGPTRNSLDANNVIFDGLPRLAAKADTTYRVRVQGAAPGDLRTRIQLMTDEMTSPVTKEESTRVFAEE